MSSKVLLAGWDDVSPRFFLSSLKSDKTATTVVNPCTNVPLETSFPKPVKPTGPISPFAKNPATGGSSSWSSSSLPATAPSTSSSMISKSTLLLPYKPLPLPTHDTCTAANGTPAEEPVLKNNRSVLALLIISFKSSFAVLAARTWNRNVSPTETRAPTTIAFGSGTKPTTCLIKKSRGAWMLVSSTGGEADSSEIPQSSHPDRNNVLSSSFALSVTC
mmetsp:Transcript_11394/g.16979  ORF Transcript_11394/g.16979 Transcript_11394/m.16979 type:complete len:218 (-) Transcript_11394:1015-1668(-)